MTIDVARSLNLTVVHPLVDAIGWSLVHSVWQGAVIAGLLSLALHNLRHAPPGTRYLVACGALALMPLLFALTLGLSTADPSAASPTSPRSRTSAAMDSRLPAVGLPAGLQSAEFAGRRDAAPQVRAEPVTAPGAAAGDSLKLALPLQMPKTDSALQNEWLSWIVLTWLCGICGQCLQLAWGWVRLVRLSRGGACPLEGDWPARFQLLVNRLGIRCSVRLVQSTRVEVPSVLGWLRPVVLVPVSAVSGLPPLQLQALLAHELAHVRRHDYLVNLLQTAVETLLFYHPAAWWVSRVIRAEREACCDELAVAVIGDRVTYVRALATMEELRVSPSRLVLAANGGPLLTRVRRLLGQPATEANRGAWWIVAAVAAVLALGWRSPASVANAEREEPAPQVSWGAEVNGLRCRLYPVATTVDDESPGEQSGTGRFATGKEVAFVVELRNVSSSPVTLVGVHYGEAYAGSGGKLATSFFAPHLFAFEFEDSEGHPIPRAKREFVSEGLHLQGASTHEIAPEGVLRIVLRPAKLGEPIQQVLPPGEYRARVRYLGLKAKERELIAKHWPESAHVRAWQGQALSNTTELEVDPPAEAVPEPELVWGEEVDGLEAATELRVREEGSASRPLGGQAVPLNTVLEVVHHIRNVSDEKITLVSETWRQDDQAEVHTADDQVVKVQGTWYSGWPTQVRWTLQPGEIAELNGTTLAVAVDNAALEQFEHPVGKWIITKPGRHEVQYSLRIGSLKVQDADGAVLVPTRNDWQGTLVTGLATLEVRERTPADEEALRKKLLRVRIELGGRDGSQVAGGYFKLRAISGRRPLGEGTFENGLIEVEGCPPKPMVLTVRAPGYEEMDFQDLRPIRNKSLRLELTPTPPSRFRLISSIDGSRVARARVRFFNRTAGLAIAGPVPSDGTAGPTWAMSDDEGVVTLPSLQRVDPQYPKLGDSLYYFFVEPADLAPRFVGPIRAGQDLGDLEVGPYLEVRGEIRGTPRQLADFDAEWDQPFIQETDNPDAAWMYAESKPLELVREADPAKVPMIPPQSRRRFVLKNLRPGKLRIVASFQPADQRQVSHTYGRRDPKGADVVFEFDLTESLNDVVLTPAGQPRAEPQPD